MLRKSSASLEYQFSNTHLTEYITRLREEYTLGKKIALIQAPQFLFDSFNVDIVKARGYYAYPPTGLQCLAESLSNRGLDIDIFDLNYTLLKRVINDETFNHHNWLELLEEYLDREVPSIVGVTSINVYRDVFEPGYPLTSILQCLKHRGESIVLAGGPIATSEYQNYLMADLCHFVIESEGEYRVNFLLDHLFEVESPQFSVRGIHFKSNGEIKQTEGQQVSVELEKNLIDTYSLIPIEDYHNVGSLNPYSRMSGQEHPYSVFLLNRGCRANCDFCGVPDFMGRGVRQSPVSEILNEITYLVEQRGIKHFDVLDDDFLRYEEAVVELLQGIKSLRQKHGITWASNNGLIGASITEELMALMHQSGCVGFRIGVESGNPEMLKKMRKPGNLTTLRQAGVIMNKFPDVFTGANYIIGLFGTETFGEMMDTFRFSCELDLDWSSFATFQFTSKKKKEMAEGLQKNQHASTDFVPSKADSKREISSTKDIFSGSEIFDLPKDIVPSPEQIQHIWFCFNLVMNYINNRNLQPEGRPGKFTYWVEAVKVAYPDNPYMSLFAGLGRVLMGDMISAHKHLEITAVILKKSEYWKHRFLQFNLADFVVDFPEDSPSVYEMLEYLKETLKLNKLLENCE